MASAAYAYKKQIGSSEAQIKRSQFVVIDGGLNKKGDSAKQVDGLTKHVAPYVPTENEASAVRPHPRHADLSVFAIGVIVALAICVVSVFASRVMESKLANAVTAIPASEYTVVSGDSLSSIAQAHPIQGHSTSDVVSWIVERNNLESALIIPGQALMVPSIGA